MITLPKKKGARKSIRSKRVGGMKAVALLWAKRAGIWGGAAIFIAWIGAWIVLSNTPQKIGNWAAKEAVQASVDSGFSVEQILIEGRVHTDPAILRGIVNMQTGDPIFNFNPAEAQNLIEQISWVKTARVERRLPGTIYIDIEEREPLALWQNNQKLQVIDAEGEVLTNHNLKRFKDLIIVTGQDAPKHAAELIVMLRAEPEIAPYAEAASRVGARRWNLTLKNGVIVKLPEEDMGFALRRLAVSQGKDGLLEKDVSQIDLRDPAQIVVRTRPGQVQTYKASL